MTADPKDLSDEELRRDLRKTNNDLNRSKARLRALIKEMRSRGVSQADIGKELEISQSAVSQRLKQMKNETTE